MHFAMLELRYALVAFYRAFPNGVRLASKEGFTAAEMEPVSLFLMPPKGKRCLVEEIKTDEGSSVDVNFDTRYSESK